ncbi:hypothetical protein Tco_0725268 [Tanacetum coccineum]|uniref:Reverse transcriptase domain-containing protein n=1 Tax=Tanacetum coccineum TaxID=301880 RepID=A0ABQ4YEU1_9ASTR
MRFTSLISRSAYESLVIPLEEIQVDDKLHFIKESVQIMDREIKQLKRSRIPIIKVRWNSKRDPKFNWERELQQDSPAEEAETESNVWDDGSEDANPFGGDEEEEYPFVNKYPSFQEEPIVLVEEESCPVYDTDNEEEQSMPVYDIDIEDVIKEEEGFVGKGGFGREEDNIEDVVVMAHDLCSSMIQTILSVDFKEDINTKSHKLMSFGKSIIIKVSGGGVFGKR